MAIISQIQRFKYILVGLIGLCILTFLFEVINPNLNALTSGSTNIGEVNGEALKYEDYKSEYDAAEKDLRLSKNGQNPSEDELDAVKNQIWSKFLVKNVIDKSMDKLGLGVSPAELVEITTGQHIDPNLQNIPAFKNQMGQYDPMLFKNFLKTLNQDDPSLPPGTRKKQWLEFEKQVVANRKISKFNSLISNALYVPKWLNDYETKNFGTSADINYVVLPPTAVDAEKIKVEKSDVETYFKENKNKYAQPIPTVKLATVSFPLVPSSTDSADIYSKFMVKMEDMRNAKNDTAFFKAYGDKGFDQYYYKQDELASNPAVNEIFAASTGSIIGPFRNDDNVNAVKVIGRRNIADSVFVIPLTISFRDVGQNQAAFNARLKLVDSVFKMLDTLNMDFAQVASQFSADRGQTQPMWISRADNTWNLEVFFLGGNKRYFKSPSDREGVVRILKVLNFPANKPAVMIGQISAPYAPSTETQNAIYGRAMDFIAKCKTASDIQKIAKTYPNLQTSNAFVNQGMNRIEGIEGNGREAIRWAFDSKSGDLSSMIQIGNNYVYAGNLGLRDREHLKFDDVYDDILPDYKREKALQLIADKMNGANLQEIATKNNTTVQTLTGLNFNSGLINNIPEPAVVAAAISVSVNKISKAVRGNGGVYRIISTKTYPSATTPAEALNLKTQINQMQKSTQGILDAMINDAKVKDNRVNMF